MKLVLASKSPRRSEILKNAGYDFEIRVADADETIPAGTKPEDAVVFLAARKAMAVNRADRDKRSNKCSEEQNNYSAESNMEFFKKLVDIYLSERISNNNKRNSHHAEAEIKVALFP